MGAIVRLAWELCWLRKGPQDVPYSRWLFYVVLVTYSVVSLLVLLLSSGWFEAGLQLLADVSLTLVVPWLLLMLGGRPARFLQTATALLLADALITLCALPVFAAMTAGQHALLFAILTLLLMAWHWVVIGSIFRHALTTSFAFGLCLALFYIIGSYQIMNLLFSAI